jgi:hypothetical protein
MKTTPRFLLAVLVTATSPHLSAQTPANSTTARILGDLPDAVSPTAPKPGFTVKPADILTTQVHRQGGRTITLSEIRPITLPTPLQPTPPALSDLAVQQRLKISPTDPQDAGLILAGATVFRQPDGTARSLVTLTSATTGETITFLSSADFGLLASIGTFSGTDGKNRSLILSWSVEPCENTTDLTTRLQASYGLKKTPKLPPGTASYTLLTGNPDPATRTALQSLHQIYTTEHPRLLAAHQASLLQQTTLNSAAPPPPKNLVLNHWNIGTSTPASVEGGTK